MDTAADIPEALTPETRRGHLRAIADRMLLALSREDDPKTGEEIEKGIRRALLIERLYARCDATQAKAIKNAVASIEQQVAAKKAIPTTATPPTPAKETQAEIASRALAMKAKALYRATKGDPESLRQVMTRHFETPVAKNRKDTS
jgi:IS5 family transposase